MTAKGDKRLEEQLRARLRRHEAKAPAASFVTHRPTERQAEFLACKAFEALYGGAAGGGKTDALLIDAAQYIDVPGYAALLLRRTYRDLLLPDGILTRALEWWGGRKDVHWSAEEYRFTFPSGASLTFGYCDNDRDRYRYQGAQVQYLGVDELTQWPETWYRYLISRVRKPATLTVPLRVRATSNPGGIGHEWVRRRFVAAGAVGSFVPARLEDNPHLDHASYRESLSKLDPVTRKQLEEGLWIRDGQGLVYRQLSDANFIEAPPPELRPDAPPGKRGSFLLAQDFGVTNATSWSIWGWRRHDPVAYLLRSWKRTGVIPSENGEIVAALEASYGFQRIVGDVGGLGKGYAEEARRRFKLPIEPAKKENKRGYIDLFNGDLARKRVQVVRPECQDFITEALELPWNIEQTAEAEGFENHCTDGALYGWRAVAAFLESPEQEKPKNEAEYWQRIEAEEKARDAARGQQPGRGWLDDMEGEVYGRH